MYQHVSIDRFLDAFEHARNISERVRNNTDEHTAIHYVGGRAYLTADSLSGYVVMDNGELISVFNVGEKGRGQQLMHSAVARGATWLNCYDGFLLSFYEQFGFVETNRVANFTPGGPDVLYMEIPGFGPLGDM